MRFSAAAFVNAMAAVVFAATVALAQPTPRLFAIPGYGALALAVPDGWQVAERSLANPSSVEISMRPAAGDGWRLLITSVRIDPAKAAHREPLKDNVQRNANKLLSSATEKEATLSELAGKEASGYYFSLTSRESKNGPDDYPFVTQGTVDVGAFRTVFTFLHREPSPPQREQALVMLKDAVANSSVPPANAARPDALVVTESARGFELAVPISRLVMTIPKELMELRRAPSTTGHPRYFYFVGDVNVSGWFEPAQGYKGINAFWEREKRSIGAVKDVAITTVGKWEVVFYDMDLPIKLTNAHARAHWVQAGTWIDLHVSVMSSEGSAAARSKFTNFLQTIEIREKDK